MEDETKVTDATTSVEPTDTTTVAPADAGSATDTQEQAPETTTALATEEPAQTAAETQPTAPVEQPLPIQTTVEEPPIKPLGSSKQAPEAAVANNGPSPVGRVIVQKTLKELEDELDGGAFKSIEDFVVSHWESQDANAQRLAQVLRMDITEIWQIVKEAGIKLPQGM